MLEKEIDCILYLSYCVRRKPATCHLQFYLVLIKSLFSSFPSQDVNSSNDDLHSADLALPYKLRIFRTYFLSVFLLFLCFALT